MSTALTHVIKIDFEKPRPPSLDQMDVQSTDNLSICEL